MERNKSPFSRRLLLGSLGASALVLAGCGSAPKRTASRTTARGSIRQNVPQLAAQNPLHLSSQLRETVVARAMQTLGVPYRYGGNTLADGFDCSGMVQFAVAAATDRALPRTTQQWALASEPVANGLAGLQRGDFVFFNTSGRSFSHMGIYIGNNQFVHAPSSGGVVRVVALDNMYFAPRFDGARTVFL